MLNCVEPIFFITSGLGCLCDIIGNEITSWFSRYNHIYLGKFSVTERKYFTLEKKIMTNEHCTCITILNVFQKGKNSILFIYGGFKSPSVK